MRHTMSSAPSKPARKRTVILISGRGSNMMSLVEAARAPDYPAEMIAVISNRPEAPGVAWARAQGIAATVIDHKAYKGREAFEAELDKALNGLKPDIIALAGFMRLMTAPFVRRWQDRMINIHPSLLPSFKGLHTHEAALAAGVKIAGCTVHYVRPEMDAGPIIGQAAVPVLSSDTPETLAARVLSAEHKLYPHALRLVATGRTTVADKKVIILESVINNSSLVSPALPDPA
jgi:phosphoribosylglycinamide formyltransferase-1